MTGNLKGIKKTASIFVHHKPKPKEEKKRIYKMCLNKLQSIDNADSILCKTVLIKNTLRGIQKNNKDLPDINDTYDDSRTKDDLSSPSFIEDLLNEIELTNEFSPKSIVLGLENRGYTNPQTKSKSYNSVEVLEDFHNNEAIGQTKIILSEDPSNFFDLSIKDYDVPERAD